MASPWRADWTQVCEDVAYQNATAVGRAGSVLLEEDVPCNGSGSSGRQRSTSDPVPEARGVGVFVKALAQQNAGASLLCFLHSLFVRGKPSYTYTRNVI